VIICRTPFRVSFFGGGTDYPIRYQESGGAVLATTIDKYCYITCRYLPPFFDYKHRIVYSKTELIKDTKEIEHPSVRETLRFMNIDEGIEIHHDADLPSRTGLGSSSSFTVGLLHALYALKGLMPTKIQLAREAIHIEQNMIKENVGSQDQIITSCGGFNHICFGGQEEFQLQPITLNDQKLELLQDHLMLFFTGFSREASVIAEQQIKNTPSKKKELNTMVQMVYEAIDILNRNSGDILEFGRLLHEGWQLKRSLTDKISTPEIDDVYTAARNAGAIGGKLLGAGGGGFFLLFAEPEIQPRIIAKLNRFLHVPFKFESLGSRIIFNETNTTKQYMSRVLSQKESKF